MDDDYTTTMPVILVGVGKRILRGFSEIVLDVEGEGARSYRGVISVEMANDRLVISVKPLEQGDKKYVPPPDTSGS
jgi:hypothetical protein